MSSIYYINRLNKRKHRIILVDAERAFDKIQYPFTTEKKSRSTRVLWDRKPTVNIGLNSERLRLGTGRG